MEPKECVLGTGSELESEYVLLEETVSQPVPKTRQEVNNARSRRDFKFVDRGCSRAKCLSCTLDDVEVADDKP